MDPITQQTVLAAAGAAKGDPIYVDDVFSTDLYDGNGTTQTIVNGIDLDGEGGMVMQRRRSTSGAWFVNDTENGANNFMYTNYQSSLGVGTTASAFNSNGFTIGAEDNLHGSGNDVVSWTFRKAPGFFDVVTYNGSTGAQSIAHNLGSAPGMIIIKCTSHNSDWRVYHRSQGATKYCGLNSTYQFDYSASLWNDTAPTSTHFTVNTSTTVNGSGRTFVAYVFAHDDAQYGRGLNESIIKCGTYTGNSGAQAIDLGFEPQWVMVKNASVASNWCIFDVMRNFGSKHASTTASPDQSYLKPNEANQENTDLRFNVTNTGFELNNETNNQVNYSGNTYIYMAIRRSHKPPTAGTEVYQALWYAGSNSNIKRATNFAVDMVHSNRTDGGTPYVLDRRRGRYQYISTSNAQVQNAQNSSIYEFGSNYLSMGNGPVINGSGDTYIVEMFKRATGFFDIVSYSGTSTSDHAVPHNLGAVPELVFAKPLSWNNTFSCYTSTGGLGRKLTWSNASAENLYTTAGTLWGPTAFTSTHIYLSLIHI